MKIIIIILLLSTTSISASNVVNVIAPEYPPYIQSKNGKIGGFSINAVRAGFKKLNIEPRFHIYPYSRAVSTFINNPDYVFIGSLEGVPGYQQMELHMVGYLKYSTTLFYNKSLNPQYSSVNSYEQLAGKKIASLSGSDINNEMIKFHGASIINVNDQKQFLPLVEKGRVDFAHEVRTSGAMAIAEHNYISLAPLTMNTLSSIGGLVFSQSNKLLAESYYQSMSSLHDSGALKTIFADGIQPYPVLKVDDILNAEVVFKSTQPGSVQQH